jgi:hypothetical protein
MKKWKRWMGISAAILIVLGITGFIGMQVVVDFVLTQVASTVEEQPQSPTTPDVTPERTAPLPVTDEAPVIEPPTSPTATPKVEPANSDPLLNAYTSSLTEDQTVQLQAKVTTQEKLAVSSVLVKHFSVGELKAYAAMASDGITVEDKKAARKHFIERLSEEDYNRLIEIAAKYGLSQGKSYAEVQKEEGMVE